MAARNDAESLAIYADKSISKDKMISHWTETATDLLTDKCFLIRRYFEQVEYLEKLDKKHWRYYHLKESAEFQLERIKKALKPLGLPRVNRCKREICKCALTGFVKPRLPK